MKINKVLSVIIVFFLFGCSSIQIEPTPIFTAIPISRLQPVETQEILPVPTITALPTREIPVITATTDDKQIILKGFDSHVIRQLFWSKDGSKLFISTQNGIIVYDVANEKVITRFESNVVVQQVELSHDGNIFAVVPYNNPTHTPIYSPNVSIRLINAETGNLIKTINANFGLVQLGISPDGNILAALNHKFEIVVWDVFTGKEIVRLSYEDYGGNAINRIFFTPDGKSFVANFADYTYKIWDTNTWKLQNVFFCEDIAFDEISPDGTKFATSGGGRHEPTMWEFNSGKKLFELSAKSPVEGASIAFNPNGKYIAVSVEYIIGGGYPPDIQKIATTVDQITIYDVNTGKIIRELTKGGMRLKFSPDGTKLASVSESDNSSEIVIWDISEP